MISEFEQRLADILGIRLPAPFSGNVEVASGAAVSGPKILLGVQHAEALEDDLGHQRPEIVPGSNDLRRIMRLKCTVGLEVFPAAGPGRTQSLQGVQAAFYALEAADFKNGKALVQAGDPGFLIQKLKVLQAQTPLHPEAPNSIQSGLTLAAEGWFWPVGEAGITGIPIGEIRVRGVTLAIAITPANPQLIAGGSSVEFTLRLVTSGPLRLGGATPLPPLPFGVLAVFLRGPGGKPGAGTLSGGAAGVEGSRLIALGNNEATITYNPPVQKAREELVVALEDGGNGAGLEIGRMALVVK